MSLNTADLLSLKGVCLPLSRPLFSCLSVSLSPYLRGALTLLLLQVLLSVINPVLMAYSFCSSTHISLVYFPTLVNLGTRHKRSDIRAIISGNYQMPSPTFSLFLTNTLPLSCFKQRHPKRSSFSLCSSHKGDQNMRTI